MVADIDLPRTSGFGRFKAALAIITRIRRID